MSERLRIHFRIEPNGTALIADGRDAWALNEIANAGDKGYIPIANPALRWSAYIYNLRQLGLVIETIHEAHGGPFPGTHARYVLRSEITVLEGSHGKAA